MEIMNKILRDLYIKRVSEQCDKDKSHDDNHKITISIINDALDNVLFRKSHDEEWKAKAYVVLSKIDYCTLTSMYPQFHTFLNHLTSDIPTLKYALADDLIILVELAFNDMGVTFKIGGAK